MDFPADCENVNAPWPQDSIQYNPYDVLHVPQTISRKEVDKLRGVTEEERNSVRLLSDIYYKPIFDEAFSKTLSVKKAWNAVRSEIRMKALPNAVKKLLQQNPSIEIEHKLQRLRHLFGQDMMQVEVTVKKTILETSRRKIEDKKLVKEEQVERMGANIRRLYKMQDDLEEKLRMEENETENLQERNSFLESELTKQTQLCKQISGKVETAQAALEIEKQLSLDKIRDLEIEKQSSLDKIRDLEVQHKSSLDKIRDLEIEKRSSLDKFRDLEVELSLFKSQKVDADLQQQLLQRQLDEEKRSTLLHLNTSSLQQQLSNVLEENRTLIERQSCLQTNLIKLQENLSKNSTDEMFGDVCLQQETTTGLPNVPFKNLQFEPNVELSSGGDLFVNTDWKLVTVKEVEECSVDGNKNCLSFSSSATPTQEVDGQITIALETTLASDPEHEDIPKPITKPPKRSSKYQFICPECGQVYQSSSAHIRHRKEKHGVIPKTSKKLKPRQCSFCDRLFGRPYMLDRHEKVCRKKSKPV